MKYFTKNETQILKGLAVLMVLANHCISVYHANPYYYDAAVFGQIVSVTKLSVAIFAVLSGYGMYCSMSSGEDQSVKNVIHFAAKHLWHIYKIFWPAAIVQIFLISVFQKGITEIYPGHTALYFLLDCIGISNMTETPQFAAAWWYIGAVLIDYLLFPLLYFMVEKLKKYTVGLIPITTILLIWSGTKRPELIYAFFFLYGMIFAKLNIFDGFMNLEYKKRKLTGIKLLASTAVFILLMLLRQSYAGLMAVEYYIDWLIVVVLIWMVTTLVGITGQKIWIPLKTVGVYSFELYIVHSVFLKYASEYIYHPYQWKLSLLKIFVMAFAGAVIVKILEKLLYHIIDEKIMSWRKNHEKTGNADQ